MAKRLKYDLFLITFKFISHFASSLAQLVWLSSIIFSPLRCSLCLLNLFKVDQNLISLVDDSLWLSVCKRRFVCVIIILTNVNIARREKSHSSVIKNGFTNWLDNNTAWSSGSKDWDLDPNTLYDWISRQSSNNAIICSSERCEWWEPEPTQPTLLWAIRKVA